MTRPDSNPSTSAVEKAVALMEDIDGPMQEPCPICRGGWWREDGVLVAAVHAVDCTAHDDLPSREPAYVGSRHDQIESLIRQAFMEAE